jgi:Fe-S cluster assembly scaffold protein SufB
LADLGVTIDPFPSVLRQSVDGGLPFLRASEKPADRLSALGLALLNRGYRLTIPAQVGRPVFAQDLTILSQPHEALSIRRTVSLGGRSRLLMTEEVFSMPRPPDHQRLYASSVDVDVGQESRAAYLTVHAPDSRVVSLYQRHASVQTASRMGWIFSGFGGFRTKARNTSELPGQGADLEDLQSFFGTEHQAYDSSVTIRHLGTDTHGQSITRGVFRDEARGMSRGLVRIEPDARKTVSYISEHAMLLSRGARSDTIPILEILCRDVKATHSTSVAPVDPEKVFYLQSRGIESEDAIRMIGEGFLSYVLDRAPIANLREVLYPALTARWENRELWWEERKFPALPELAFGEMGAGTDWRFDAKLR